MNLLFTQEGDLPTAPKICRNTEKVFLLLKECSGLFSFGKVTADTYSYGDSRFLITFEEYRA